MNDQRTGWRNTPPILLAAFALELAFGVAHMVQRLSAGPDHDYASVDRWQLASSGVWVVFTVMVGIGLLDLARRRTGGAGVALRIASMLIFLQFATLMAVNLASMFNLVHGEWLFDIDRWLAWVLAVSAALALAIAAWGRSPALAVIAFTAWSVGYLPPPIGEALFRALDPSDTGLQVLFSSLGILQSVATIVLAIAATDGIAAPRRELATGGFSMAANALTLRVVAAAIGMLFTLVAVATMSSGGSSGEGIIKFAMFAGLAVNLVSFAMFGIGALNAARSGLDGVPAWTAAIAAAASLWCMGVMLDQLPRYYQILYGDMGGSSSAQERLQALSVAMPLIATLSGAVFAGAISAYARSRNDEDLIARAKAAGIGYVLLMLASVGITSFLLDGARTVSGAVGMMLVAAACGLAAQVMLSRVCRSASIATDEDPGLPMAVAKVNDPT